jgi:DNA polymerase-1
MEQNPTLSFDFSSSTPSASAVPFAAAGTKKKPAASKKKKVTRKKREKTDSPAYESMSQRPKKSSEVPDLDENTLVLVDISSFIFRAFFAIPVLHSPKGEPTNAVYGVANMMMKLVDDAKPSYLMAVFDSKTPSFRHEMYDEYKANRSEPPEDLRPQFARIEELADRLKLPKLRVNGFEADDLIATLTRDWSAKEDRQVIIVSGDKDLMQLVGPRVRVWDTMKGKVFDDEAVKEKFGVGPAQIRDYLSMVGDSSDNVPGIPGIGPKTAVTLLADYPELDQVIDAAKAGKIKGKRGQTIAETEDVAKLSQDLVTLREDVPMEGWTDEAARYQFEIDRECVGFFRDMGFRTLVQKYEPLLSQPMTEEGTTVDAPSFTDEMEAERFEMVGASLEFETVSDRRSLDRLIESIASRGEFCVDLETTSLNPREAEVVGIALSPNARRGYYVPVGHRDGGQQLARGEVLQALRPVLEDPKIKLIGQNLKYDLSIFHQQGIRPVGVGADTMVASYVLDPSGSHGFDALCERYLNYRPVSYTSLVGKGKDQKSFAEVPIDQATRYAAEDALYTLRLWDVMRPELHKRQLMEVFARVDLPLVPVLTDMEERGVRLDTDFLAKLSTEFGADIEKIEAEIQSYAKNGPVNLNSPKQLATLLFEELGLPVQAKTKTGYSTDAKVLDALSSKHPVPKLLLEYREISKLKSTYVDPLPTMVDPRTDRIHAKFNQTVAATGRLSSSDPNLQNIPIRTERGRLIRQAFIASPDSKILSSDYSQIELRILAHMSEDPILCESFEKGEDVHARTASELFGVKSSEVSKEQRGVAKAINFGLMYGKTPFGLANDLKISKSEAKSFIDRYFDRYRGVKNLLDGLVEEARDKQETMTLLGRKRTLREIRSSNPAVRGNAERMAMNTPIQGTAADMMKLAMIDLNDALREGGYRAKFIIQVHDEVVLDCPNEELEAVTEVVRKSLENAMDLKVPLVAESSSAGNWKDA